MNIQTNVGGLFVRRQLDLTSDGLTVALRRLSSSRQLNSARNDASGQALNERLTVQAPRTINDGIATTQVAESAAPQIGGGPQLVQEPAVQATNIATSASDRVTRQQEVSELIQGSEQNVVAPDDTPSNLGSNSLDVVTLSQYALQLSDRVNGELGAQSVPLDSTSINPDVAVETDSAAQSPILDAAVASETSALTRNIILSDAGTAVQTQATAAPQTVLALMR